jgi:hypothetical protein
MTAGSAIPAAGFRDAAADEQPSLLYRLARQCLPLAGAEGRSARRRDLSGLCRTEVLYDDKGAVRGIATGDMGIAKDGSHKDSFTRGMELLGKYTLFAEGARGSLTKQLIAKFSLDANSQPPKFGIGSRKSGRSIRPSIRRA